MNDSHSHEFTKTQLRIIHGLSFLVPVLIMGTVFAINGVYPFGTEQILVTDLWQQYFPFISVYWHRIREGNSFLWSWTAGGGHDYLAHIAYYMASPFNLLAALFPHDWLREVLTLFLLFKLGFAGFFMSLYMRFALGKVDILTPIFATFYAVCAFVIGYFWNIMWMDTLALMPLVILGVHYIVTEGKYILFIISLALAILFNFYIGVFVCIFVAITFFAKSFYTKLTVVQFIQRLGIVVVSAGIALGISAIITLPAASALQLSYRSSIDFPQFRFIRSFVDVFGNFIAFTPATAKDGLPNLYTGMISIMLVPTFIMSSKISVKEKIAYMVMIVFLVLSVNINILDFTWNAFTITNSLPFRFSFIASFIVAVMAYRAYTTMDMVRMRDIIGMAASAAFFVLMAIIGPQQLSHALMAAGLAVVYIAVFGLVFILQKKRARSPGYAFGKHLHIIKFVLFAVILFEVTVTANNGLGGTTDHITFPLNNEQIQYLLSNRQSVEEVDFFRTDMSQRWSTNDPSLYNYHGISLFSSMVNVHVSNFMERMGLRAWPRGNSFGYLETSPLTNAFLNMRYMIARDGNPAMDTGVFWDITAQHGTALLLRNNRHLPLGFMVQPEVADFWGESHNPFNSQNELFRMATGLDGDLFTLIDIRHVGHRNYRVPRYGLGDYRFYRNEGYDSGSFRFNYFMYEDSLVFAFIRMHGVRDWRVTSEGETLINLAMYRAYIAFAGEFEAGRFVSFEANADVESGHGQIFVATLDRELFDRGFEILNSQTLELTRFTDTRVDGVVNVTQPGMLYTSIPHSNNWRVFVNGQRQELVSIAGAMAGVMINDVGVHEVSFRFHNRALNLGVLLALVSLIVLAVLWYLSRKGWCVFEFVYSKLFGTVEKDERIKYLFFGGVTTFINWGMFSVMVAVVGLAVFAGNIIAWISAVAFAFVVNKILVFQNRNRRKKVILQQMLKFLGVRLVSGLIEIIGVPLIFWLGLNQSILGVDGFAAKLVVSIVVLVLNYILSKTFVFKER